MPPVFRGQQGSGIPVHTTTGPFGQHHWSRRWMADIEALASRNQITRGRSVARSRHVLDLQIGWNTVFATVQGSQPEPFTVTVKCSALDEEETRSVHRAVQEIGLAAALAGTVSDELATIVLPSPGDRMRWSCSCPDQPGPCAHVVAAMCVLVERIDKQPQDLFRLRGFPPRGRLRSGLSDNAAADDGESAIHYDDSDTVRFWDADPALPPPPAIRGSITDLLDSPVARSYTAALAQGNTLAALAIESDLDDFYQAIRDGGDQNVRHAP